MADADVALCCPDVRWAATGSWTFERDAHRQARSCRHPNNFEVWTTTCPQRWGLIWANASMGDRSLSSAGIRRTSALPMRVPNPSPENRAPMGPEIYPVPGLESERRILRNLQTPSPYWINMGSSPRTKPWGPWGASTPPPLPSWELPHHSPLGLRRKNTSQDPSRAGTLAVAVVFQPWRFGGASTCVQK